MDHHYLSYKAMSLNGLSKIVILILHYNCKLETHINNLKVQGLFSSFYSVSICSSNHRDKKYRREYERDLNLITEQLIKYVIQKEHAKSRLFLYKRQTKNIWRFHEGYPFSQVHCMEWHWWLLSCIAQKRARLPPHWQHQVISYCFERKKSLVPHEKKQWCTIDLCWIRSHTTPPPPQCLFCMRENPTWLHYDRKGLLTQITWRHK